MDYRRLWAAKAVLEKMDHTRPMDSDLRADIPRMYREDKRALMMALQLIIEALLESDKAAPEKGETVLQEYGRG